MGLHAVNIICLVLDLLYQHFSQLFKRNQTKEVTFVLQTGIRVSFSHKVLVPWAFILKQIVHFREVQIKWWQVRQQTVDWLTTSECLMLLWHFASWSVEAVGALTAPAYCSLLLLHNQGNYMWTRRAILTWPLASSMPSFYYMLWRIGVGSVYRKTIHHKDVCKWVKVSSRGRQVFWEMVFVCLKNHSRWWSLS